MLLSRRHCRRKGHQRNLPGGGRRYAPAQSEWLSPLPRICCAIPSSGAMPSTTEPDSRGNGSPSSEALAIERAGEEATRTAICEHLGDGRAVYYTDPSRPEARSKSCPAAAGFSFVSKSRRKIVHPQTEMPKRSSARSSLAEGAASPVSNR